MPLTDASPDVGEDSPIAILASAYSSLLLADSRKLKSCSALKLRHFLDACGNTTTCY